MALRFHSLNQSKTYFELDSEEATHCPLICCVYIKGLLHCVMYAMLFVDTVNMKIKACNALNSVCCVVC